MLEPCDFTAEPGQTTAIIGSTGSGKSTVVKLIERFYDVTAGSVTVDGVDVRDVTQAGLRAQLGYVPQKAFLFSGTIAVEHRLLGRGHARGAHRAAAQVAQAADFIASKARGARTPRCRRAARTCRAASASAWPSPARWPRRPRAYLFDDSFSALDYKTDAALRQALHTRLGGKTVVIVAQRISTVLHADQIVVLDEGRVVGQGTHEELMEGCESTGRSRCRSSRRRN